MKLAHHPNVVRVFDFSIKDTEQHGPYIVMELLEGESLQEHLKRKRTLEPKVAARIVADVASKRNTDPAQVYASLQKAGRLQEIERSITEDKVFAYLMERSTVE